jgi:Phage integrase family
MSGKPDNFGADRSCPGGVRAIRCLGPRHVFCLQILVSALAIHIIGQCTCIASWKTAWKAARKVAGRTLSGKPEGEEVEASTVRTHDLRHTAITRMLNAGVPLPKVAKIVGWSLSTMVKVAARYGYFTTDDLRNAVEAISSSQIHEPKTSVDMELLDRRAGASERATRQRTGGEKSAECAPLWPIKPVELRIGG